MADVTTHTTFAIKLTEKEFRLVAAGLALLAGVKVQLRADEKHAAAELNARLLEVQGADLRQRLTVVDGKLEYARQALTEAPDA